MTTFATKNFRCRHSTVDTQTVWYETNKKVWFEDPPISSNCDIFQLEFDLISFMNLRIIFQTLSNPTADLLETQTQRIPDPIKHYCISNGTLKV